MLAPPFTKENAREMQARSAKARKLRAQALRKLPSLVTQEKNVLWNALQRVSKAISRCNKDSQLIRLCEAHDRLFRAWCHVTRQRQALDGKQPTAPPSSLPTPPPPAILLPPPDPEPDPGAAGCSPGG